MSLLRVAARAAPGFRGRAFLALIPLFLILLGATLLGAAVGAVSISPLDIIGMSLSKLGGPAPAATWSPAEEVIFLQIRLPRVIGAALVGAALASAGVIFQGLLRNPLADPYIIGTSAGAALGATLALMLPLGLLALSFGLVSAAAFVGALLTVLLVYRLARIGRATPIISLLLAGFATSSLLIAAMTFLLTVSDRLQLRIRQVFAFLFGGVSVGDWGQLLVVAPLILGALLLSWVWAWRLNAFAVGEEGAAYLGIEVERDKLIFLALGSLLTAAAVAISGLVGFVGLVIPHGVRLVLGPDHRLLLPASALVGASFLVLADMLARIIIAPSELPVGVITALIGAPFFIYLLRRGGRDYAF